MGAFQKVSGFQVEIRWEEAAEVGGIYIGWAGAEFSVDPGERVTIAAARCGNAGIRPICAIVRAEVKARRGHVPPRACQTRRCW